MLEPANIEELQDAVRDHTLVLPVGARTKTRLTLAPAGCELISTRKLSGITDYNPSEYTFTALAGTPVAEINEAVGAKGQFLPCSTLLSSAGATLGGAVASGLSGAGRFRFGGLRDFLLGIRLVTGEGKHVSAGGRVVKNSAGFDLPKFMVGSLGRFGILTELTFKVFPRPSRYLTLRVACDSHTAAVERIARAARSRWELYAIDYQAENRALFLRLGGPAGATEALADEISTTWPDQVERLADPQATAFWDGLRELSWVPEGSCVAKVPTSAKSIPPLQAQLERLDGARAHYSVAGNVAYIAAAKLDGIGEILTECQLRGLTVIGGAGAPLWLGTRRDAAILGAVKRAIDPDGRFPDLHQ